MSYLAEVKMKAIEMRIAGIPVKRVLEEQLQKRITDVIYLLFY
ncbi:hypothetical protein [Paenibacillus macquariensis]|nr:hypothetical protein [Paenibacillus macquariensis]MEC0092675.1 hypothetical protein [Paenibacillus macquariensis]